MMKVGNVHSQSGAFAMTLHNKRIVVTRTPHQAGQLVGLLQERDAVPLIYPCVDIAPPHDPARLDSALRNLSAYEWLIVTSSSTVLAMKRRLGTLGVTPDLGRLKIAAVGAMTAEAVQQFLGTMHVALPDGHSSEDIVKLVNPYHGMRILLPQSAVAPAHLSKVLTMEGADVTAVEAYQIIKGSGGEDIPAMLRDQRVDALTFASVHAVQWFLERIAPESAFHLPAACLSEAAAEAARAAGFQQVLVPEHFTPAALLHLLDQVL
jgi:uroporphyrinogen-III synthase